MSHRLRADGRKLQRLGLLVLCLLPAIPLGAADQSRGLALEHRQLFLDDAVIARQEHLRRVWHRPVKDPQPVLRREHAWEGRGPYAYGTVRRDEQSGQFQFWYNCYVGGRPDYFACYATSTDGLRWDRPRLDVVRDPRLPPGENNVVLSGSGLPHFRQCISPSVLVRPTDPDPNRRYAMVYWDLSADKKQPFFGLCLAHSPDGVHWTNDTRNPVFVGVSDVSDACYDPRTQRYLLHYKMWRVEGQVVGSQLARGQAGSVTYWPTWDSSRLEGGRVRFAGWLADYASADSSPQRATVDFAAEPTYRRVVARAESLDLVHWTNARVVLELPEKNDPTNLSTYGMSVFPYEGQYVGLLRTFHGDREIEVELAYSRDDLQWQRADPGQPFVPRGPPGSFDAGMVFSANGPVLVGDELRFYYGAFTLDHAAKDESQQCAIGLARLRRDGFASMRATEQTGELLTVPMPAAGNHLVLNAAAAQGEIQVEVRDEMGQPLPGYTFADAEPFRGDATSHVVAWKGSATTRQPLAGRTVRLACRVRKADLFAFQWTDRR